MDNVYGNLCWMDTLSMMHPGVVLQNMVSIKAFVAETGVFQKSYVKTLTTGAPFSNKD